MATTLGALYNNRTQIGGIQLVKMLHPVTSSDSSDADNGNENVTPIVSVVSTMGSTTMATISAASGSSRTFSKITVLSENNSNALNISKNNHTNGSGNGGKDNDHDANTIVRKIKDFGMFGAVNNATSLAKPSVATLTAKKRPSPEGTVAKEKVKSFKRTKPNKAEGAAVTKKSANNGTSKPAKTPKTTKRAAKTATGEPRLKLKTLTNLPMGTLAGTGANSLAGGLVVAKPAGTPGRKGLPLPQAVARRNARERNRVKQVNNGFAALRERIPEEVAEAFEAQAAATAALAPAATTVSGGSGSGSASSRSAAAKKLSKVETLRMAVEYIRGLERLLGFESDDMDFASSPHGTSLFDEGGPLGSSSFSGTCDEDDDSFMLVKDEFDTLSPSMDEPFDDSMSNYDMDEYFGGSVCAGAMDHNPAHDMTNSFSEDAPPPSGDVSVLLPNVTTLHGLQYIRFPGTNTYQLLAPDHLAAMDSLGGCSGTSSGGNSNSSRSVLDLHDEAGEAHFNDLIAATNCLDSPPLPLPPPQMLPSIIGTTATTTAQAIATMAMAAACAPALLTSAMFHNMPPFASTPIPGNPAPTAASSLSRSPVLQTSPIIAPAGGPFGMPSPPASSSSPTATTMTTALHHANMPLPHATRTTQHELARRQQQPAMLSPAANELLLRAACGGSTDEDSPERIACGTSGRGVPATFVLSAHQPQQQQQQQQHQQVHFLPRMIKQEFNGDASMPVVGASQDVPFIYQTSVGHATAMSPSLDPTAGATTMLMGPSTGNNDNNSGSPSAVGSLQAFYDHDQNGGIGASFYESGSGGSGGVGGLGVVAFKKELDGGLLDSSQQAGGVACLSDESMIDAIDWWEAHTPKSEGGSSVIM